MSSESRSAASTTSTDDATRTSRPRRGYDSMVHRDYKECARRALEPDGSRPPTAGEEERVRAVADELRVSPHVG